MIIIIEVLQCKPCIKDRTQIQNFFLDGNYSLIINGDISLIDESHYLPMHSHNISNIYSSNSIFGNSYNNNSSNPRLPLKYKVNVTISGFNTPTKEEIEGFIKKKSNEANMYNLKIVDYEFEYCDNLKVSKTQKINTFFPLESEIHLEKNIPTFTFTSPPKLTNILSKYKQQNDLYSPHIDVVIRRAAAAGNLEDLTVLVNVKGIDINSQDSTPGKHFTALHWAAKRGHLAVYQFLIDNGAALDIQDASQKRPSEYLPNFNNKSKNSDFDYSKIFNSGL
jgi:hypothetical protein